MVFGAEIFKLYRNIGQVPLRITQSCVVDYFDLTKPNWNGPLNHGKEGKTMYNRARWIWSERIKWLKIKTGHLYSNVKLNFKAGLFSCIFLFEAIFLGNRANKVAFPFIESCSQTQSFQRPFRCLDCFCSFGHFDTCPTSVRLSNQTFKDLGNPRLP